VRVAVLGAGLQGVCIALELARRGVDVDLIEQDTRPLNRASLRNEGKIHLGLVYANDATLATADAMLDGALRFRALLAGWTARRFDRVARSHPFQYLVATDSLLGPETLAAHYQAVDDRYRARIAADASLDYLGARPDRLWRRVPDVELPRRGAAVAAVFESVEVAIDLAATAALLRDAIAAAPRVRFHPGRRVLAVGRSAQGFIIEGNAATVAWTLDADQVVNALWDGRLLVDAGLGLTPRTSWSHRLKYRVLVELPPALHGRPSMTVVLGAYGDVVVHPGGQGYVSWYPECMRGWSDELAPPASWNDACRGVVPPTLADEIATRALAATERWFPGIAAARRLTVDAGTIFAFGQTDITHADSRLHRRDTIGVWSVDGYHTVDTGKLTTAPAFAVDAADAVTGCQAGAGGSGRPSAS
jgi:hypothetical protein